MILREPSPSHAAIDGTLRACKSSSKVPNPADPRGSYSRDVDVPNALHFATTLDWNI
jgi:hypothetical protein